MQARLVEARKNEFFYKKYGKKAFYMDFVQVNTVEVFVVTVVMLLKCRKKSGHGYIHILPYSGQY
ncbi:hypothetical protein CW304_23445 [Bacillus sp. UFRGS-B20]|nr:hypothetical protein CW304_23445 [Bacillus sp. UFRGS-B20]